MYSFEVKKLVVYIIESLGSDECQTGTQLADGLLKYKLFQVDTGNVVLCSITSKIELFQILHDIKKQVKEEFVFAILHLELHGYEDGICTNNGECVSWQEVLPLFMEINLLLRNALLITLAVCKGVSIIKYIGIMERAPFKAIVGGVSDINADMIIKGYHAFYEKFFFTSDLYEATNELQTHIESNEIGLMFIEELYDQITDPKRNPDLYEVKLCQVMDDLFDVYSELNITNENEKRDLAEKYIEDKFHNFKSNKDTYLMNDLIDPKKKALEDKLYGNQGNQK